jgi:hypothetical protein
METNVLDEKDIYIKDEGDFVGVIMVTKKAKKTAVGSGFENTYKGQFRMDIENICIPNIVRWALSQNLTIDGDADFVIPER